MKQINAVITDFGGVLVQTINQSGRQKWEKALGLKPRQLSQVVFDTDIALQATIGKVGEEAIWDSIASTYQLSPAEIMQFRHDFWAGDWLDSELIKFLTALRPRYKTGILSNAWSGARELFCKKYHLDQVVDFMVISSEEGIAKPDPRIFKIILQKFAIKPEEAIFIDDTIENVHAARELGMIGLHYRNTQQLLTELGAFLDVKGNKRRCSE